MATRVLQIVEDEATLARELATHIVADARRALAARESFALALAGGSTPKATYALLAAEYADAFDWSRVRFFFGDERCVPPTDEQSNYRTAHDSLFVPLGIDVTNIFRMRGEDEPTTAARAYADVLRATLGGTPDGTPIFDLVLLGMGPDGHTASLFPGADPHTDDALLVRAPYVSTFATHRLTLTPHVINAARAIVVATAGYAKAQALHAVFDGPHDPMRYPIAVLAPRNGTLDFIVDRAAASQLARRD
jgi:6-phosphogluconolactonase